jgi:flagellar basal body-associated protein FliL
MAEEIETQDVKDEKQKGGKAGMSTMKMILMIVGILVVNAIVVIGVVKFFFADDHSDKPQEAQAAHVEETPEDEFSEFESEEETFFETEKQRKMLTTGRITTNPANSIKKFIVVDLGMEYRIKPEMPPEEFAEESPLMQKLHVKIKAAVTKRLGEMRVEELVRQRSELTEIFREDLQPVFNEHKMYLREVYLNEFLVQ